jgi:hypothetical protein
MDPKQILRRFVGSDDNRRILSAPSTRDGITWATDGRSRVRMPAVEGIAENKDYPNCELVFQTHCKNTYGLCVEDILDIAWIDLPKADPEKIKQFNNLEADYCEDCDGDGNVHFYSRSRIFYEFECELCGGTGHEKLGLDAGALRLPFGDIPASEYLKIGVLPGLKVLLPLIPCEADRKNAIIFKFDGGHGLVMPLREIKDSTVVLNADYNITP